MSLTVLHDGASLTPAMHEFDDRRCTIRADMIELRKDAELAYMPGRSDMIVATAIRAARDGDDPSATFQIVRICTNSGADMNKRWTFDTAAYESMERAVAECCKPITVPACAIVVGDATPRRSIEFAPPRQANVVCVMEDTPNRGIGDETVLVNEISIPATMHTKYIMHGCAVKRSALIRAVQCDSATCLIDAHVVVYGPCLTTRKVFGDAARKPTRAAYHAWLIADVVRIGDPPQLTRRDPADVAVTATPRLCAMRNPHNPDWECTEPRAKHDVLCARHSALMMHL